MFHAIPVSRALEELHSSTEGLSEEDAKARLVEQGPNTLRERERRSAIALFASQFTDILIVVLAVAAVISGLLQEWLDAYAIIAIILLNGAIGFIQEFKAEKSLEVLKKMTSPQARVVRGGSERFIDAQGLVAGDVVILGEGDRVPADGRLLATVSLEVDEAALTGESIPVRKDPGLELADAEELRGRANMVYLGTIITRGRGRALVTATGMHTELGKIAHVVAQEPEHATPLQKKLHSLGTQLSVAAFLVVVLVFAVGLWRGFPPFEMFLVSVSLAVAAIPEGLPAVVTITLAIGVQRMARKNAIIRRLPAVETLGAATVICTDKTGTLTKNEMTVRQIYTNDRIFRVTGDGYSARGDLVDEKSGQKVSVPDLRDLLSIGVLCNNSTITVDAGTGKVSITGDPTEASLLVLAEKAGLRSDLMVATHPFENELPFDSARKMMTVVRTAGGRSRAYVKGAPEALIRRSSRESQSGLEIELPAQKKEEILAINRKMASQALRVLGFAYRDLPGGQSRDGQVEEDLVFVGLAGMMDPPRAEAKAAVSACQDAGIRVVMITGDNPDTAVAVGKEIGILNEVGGVVMNGTELDGYDDIGLREVVNTVQIFARVSPEHKLRIVDALQARDGIVAMTGDGVNDAPAIKRSDIGIAMGITGTEVAKEASDMVILDDNFATIEQAVEEGRVIYENIKKSVKYLISCNIGELLVIFFAIVAGFGSPLAPIQILWMNIVTDSPPAIALAMDPPDPDVMKRPPHNPKEKILTHKLAIEMLVVGLLVAILTLGVFLWYTNESVTGALKAGTMAFSVIIMAQQFFALAVSGSGEKLIAETGVFRNRWLWYALGFGLVSQILITEWAPAQAVFDTVPLQAFDWVIVLLVASFAFLIPEGIKIVRKRKNLS